MSIFDKANKNKAAKAARKKAAGSKAAKAAVPAPSVNGGDAPEPAIGSALNPAPWANPECRACKGRGLTSKGKACPICDLTAKKGKRPTSMSYVLELDDEGLGVAVARGDDTEALEAAGYVLEWIEADAQEAAPEPADETPEPEASEAAPAEEAPEEQAEESEAPAEEQPPATSTKKPRKPRAKKGEGKAGRPSAGLTILVGAVPMRGAITSRTLITSAEALARFGAELAVDMGAESYYDLDSFKRRDRLAQKAEYIVGELARMVLVHPGILGNDDAGSLVQALMGQTEGVEAVIVRTS